MSRQPTLSSAIRDGRLEFTASGSWTAPHARDLEPLVDSVAREAAQARAAAIDMRDVAELDTYGAWLLERLTRAWTARGQELSVRALPERYQGLLEGVHGANRQAEAAPQRESRLLAALETLGRAVADLGHDAIVFVNMLGALGQAFVAMLRRPQTFRLTSAVHQLDRVGWQAVPIILLITFLIGGIIAQQGFFHFRKFGADEYVVDMVGILVLREIGVLIVAIMVAGRSGSSYTAELGSMKMREEIDALRTMGLDPGRGADPAARDRAGARPADADLPRLDGGALRRRPGRLALRRHEPGDLHRAPEGGDLGHAFQGRHDQGAVHGAGDRRRRLLRGLAGEGQRRVRSGCRPPPRSSSRSSW